MARINILRNHHDTVKQIIGFLTQWADEEFRKEFLNRNEEKVLIIDKRETKKNRLKLGHFSVTDAQLVFAILAEEQGTVFKNTRVLIEATFRRLQDHHVLLPTPFISDEYQIVEQALLIYQASGLLDSIIFGVSHTIEKFQRSIPAVNVENQQGDKHCGTAVLLEPSPGKRCIVTNKHVLEGNVLETVVAGDVAYDVCGEPSYCDYADLALLPVNTPNSVPVFKVLGDPEVLQPLVVVGYPRIAFTMNQYPLVHRGECNGRVKTLDGHDLIAISCHVSPGNSGGPVMSDIGEIMGIVTQSNEGNYSTVSDPSDQKLVVYHMAIPGTVVQEFISSAL